MTNSSSKISFTSSRSPFFDRSSEVDTSETHEAVQSEVSVTYEDTSLRFDTPSPQHGGLSEPLPDVFGAPKAPDEQAVAPEPHWKATKPQVRDATGADPEWQTAIEPNPFREPARKAPGFAATGLMAAPAQSFVQRHSGALPVMSVVFATFLLGVTAAMLWLDDGGARQSAEAAGPTTVPALIPAPVQEVATRSVAPDLTQVAPLPVGAVAPATHSGELAQAVLAGLTPAAQAVARSAMKARQVEAFQVLKDKKLRMMREAVLAGMFDVITVEDNGAKHVQIHTINVEMNSSFADAFLMDAVKRGQTEMGLALRTPEGGVDVTTMVFNRVQSSLFEDNTTDSIQAARDMSRKVFAASIARTDDVRGTRVYTVQPGDSLAYISLQFFGKPSEYNRILEANRDTLHSPDQIQIGQRIVIPS